MIENSKAEIIAPSFKKASELASSLGRLAAGKDHEPFYGESKEISALEREAAECFGTETAIALNAGMAAVDAAVRVVCQKKIGQLETDGKPMNRWGTFHFVVGEHPYFHTTVVFGQLAKLYRIETTVVDTTNLQQVEQSKQPNTIAIFSETTSNSFGMGVVPAISEFERILGPATKIIADISLSPTRRVTEEAQNKDNLIVVLSGTKDPSSGKVMSGFLCGTSYLNPYRETVRAAGQNLTPDKPIKPLREGLKTLDARFATASQNAQLFAEKFHQYAQEHPDIIQAVSYPGLETHPQYCLVEKLLGGNAGGILFVDFGNEEKAETFVDLVARASELETEQGHRAIIATSFGTPKTRMFPQAVVMPETMRGIIRIAAGSEPLEWTAEMDKFFERLGQTFERRKHRLLQSLARK